MLCYYGKTIYHNTITALQWKFNVLPYIYISEGSRLLFDVSNYVLAAEPKSKM